MFFRGGQPDGAIYRSVVSFGGFTALFTIHAKSRPEIIIEPVENGWKPSANLKASAIAVTRAPDVLLRLTETPVMPKSDLLATLRYTEHDSATFNLDSADTDVWIMDGGISSSKMNALFAAIPAGRATEILRSVFPAFRGNAHITVIPAAVMGLARGSASIKPNGATLYIHVDGGGFGLYAVSGGKMVFMREKPIPKTDDQSIFHKTVAGEIAQSADFFERTSGVSFDTAWLICGGAVDALRSGLTAALGMDVSIYDPSRDFSITSASQNKIPGHALPLMIGAAIDRGETICVKPRRKRYPGWLKKPASLAASVAVASLAVLGVASGYVFKSLDERIVALNNEVAALKKLSGANESALAMLSRLEAENGELKSKIATFEKAFAEPSPAFYGTLALLAAHSPDNTALTRLQINMTQEEKSASDAAQHNPSRKNTRIEGLVKGSEAEKSSGVSALLAALSGSTSFNSVTLGRLRKEPPGSTNAGMTSFEIVADLATSGKDG